MKDRETAFSFQPSEWVPFRDSDALEHVRAIRRTQIDKHPNPDFRIRVVPDSMVECIFVTDMFYRIWLAREEGRKVVLLLPNPNFGYFKLAHMINTLGVRCDHVYTFNLDEYADQAGNIAPESYPQGFLHSTKKYLYQSISPELRPPEHQVVGFTNENLADYGKMITDLGGADACYTGPGWSGHLAFIEPDAPEFEADLQEWKQMGPRIVTLGPLTIAQNSLHGSFGACGDIASVPPKAATIGPAQVIEARYRMDFHALNTAGSIVSWQRFMTRLVLHGPVTPKVPTSILQEIGADVYVSETAAADIEPIWDLAY